MIFALITIALFTLAAAAIAMSLRNLVHSALLLVVSWAGVAMFYLWAGAEFLAFAQALIYLGAISMVVLFAVLLTRRSLAELDPAIDGKWRGVTALYTGGAVAAVLFGAVLFTPLNFAAGPVRSFTVRQLGEQLMGPQVAAVLVVGVILTVALLGGVVLAAASRRHDKEDAS
ncbi:MAG: NADH-quinone oxidoreductase subunit J [Opitutae bacterium]|nr:NADH-quinone oxidoreductase subunit J [Opitutae bacterium]